MMSAALDDGEMPPAATAKETEEVARMTGDQPTHAQINAELHELRGVVAGTRLGDEQWRTAMDRRVAAIELSVGHIAADQSAMRATIETLKPAGIAQAISSVLLGIVGLFERSPLAVLVFGAVMLVWGAGGVAQVWEAVAP